MFHLSQCLHGLREVAYAVRWCSLQQYMSGDSHGIKRYFSWGRYRTLVSAASMVAVTVLALEALSPALALSTQTGRWEVAEVLGTSYNSRIPLIRMKKIWDQQGHCGPWSKVEGSVTVRKTASGRFCQLASHPSCVSLYEPQHEQVRPEEHDEPPHPLLAQEITRTAIPNTFSSSEESIEESLTVPRASDRATAAVALRESSTLELRPKRSISPSLSRMASTAVDWSVECRQHERQQLQENQNQNHNAAVVDVDNLSNDGRRMSSLPKARMPSAITVNSDTNRTDIKSNNNFNYNSKSIRDHIDDINKRRDNQVRMFFLEKGMSPEEVCKVLPMIRRDSRLMSDMGFLAAKIQVCTASVGEREGREARAALFPWKCVPWL